MDRDQAERLLGVELRRAVAEEREADAVERAVDALEALTCYAYGLAAASGALDVDASPALDELRTWPRPDGQRPREAA